MRRSLAIVAVAAAVFAAYVAVGQPRPLASTATAAPSMFAGAYRQGSCATTPATKWVVSFPRDRRFLPGTFTRDIVVGGRLATPPTRNLTVGSYWYITGRPQAEVRLRATRLDQDTPPVDFTALGYPTSEVFPPPWDVGWYYRTSVAAVDLLPTGAGCWKVAWLDGTDNDVLVVELLGVPASR